MIGDKRKDYSDVLLTSVLFDYTGIYKQMIEDLENGTFGKVYTIDVKNGGVQLLDLPADVPQDVKDAVKKAQNDIVAGKIKVDGGRRRRRRAQHSQTARIPVSASNGRAA